MPTSNSNFISTFFKNGLPLSLILVFANAYVHNDFHLDVLSMESFYLLLLSIGGGLLYAGILWVAGVYSNKHAG